MSKNINRSPKFKSSDLNRSPKVQKFKSRGNGSKHLKNRGNQEHGSELGK